MVKFLADIAMVLVACGGSSGSDPDAARPDAPLPPDVAPPDAAPPPDAIACGDASACGAQCVDITSDPSHCNGCFMPCDSPARNCVMSACACPDDPLVPVPFTPLIEQMNETAVAPDVLGIG